jgi:hypothetical protein
LDTEETLPKAGREFGGMIWKEFLELLSNFKEATQEFKFNRLKSKPSKPRKAIKKVHKQKGMLSFWWVLVTLPLYPSNFKMHLYSFRGHGVSNLCNCDGHA